VICPTDSLHYHSINPTSELEERSGSIQSFHSLPWISMTPVKTRSDAIASNASSHLLPTSSHKSNLQSLSSIPPPVSYHLLSIYVLSRLLSTPPYPFPIQPLTTQPSNSTTNNHVRPKRRSPIPVPVPPKRGPAARRPQQRQSRLRS
jgi:hypothetical protein